MGLIDNPSATRLKVFCGFLKRTGLLWLILILVFAAMMRVFNLSLLGPFIDESGYIDVARRYDYYPLYQRVGEGKVLGHVFFYPTAQWAHNPLHATRLLVAFLGVLTAVGIFLVTRRLGGQRAAILAGFIWAGSPYIVFHDRLALHDPLVSFFIVGAGFFLLAAIAENSWPKSLLSGLSFGLAILTKVTAAVSGAWLVVLGYFYLKDFRKYSRASFAFATGVTLPPLAIFLFLIPVINLVLQSGRSYTDLFLDTSSQGLTRWRLLVTNVATVREWFVMYNSSAFEVLLVLATVLTLFRPSKLKMILLLSFVISVVTCAFVFRVWFPRYLTANFIPMAILLGLVCSEWLQFSKTWVEAFIAVSLLFLLIISTLHWVTSNMALQKRPLEVRIPYIDQYQYLNGWPSGSGIAEAAAFLDNLSNEATEGLLVITGGFGTHGFWSLPLVLKDNKTIRFQYVYIGSRQDLLPIIANVAKRRTLLLLEPPRDSIPSKVFSLISPSPILLFEYKRPKAEGGFQIYELAKSTQLRLFSNQEEPWARELLNIFMVQSHAIAWVKS